jgi:hypothetical protein
MTRTVTAMFDSRAEAESAKSRLQSSSIDADRIRIVDKSSSAGEDSSSSSSDNKGFFGSLSEMFMPNEDRYAYQEGINRGGFLLCAEIDEDQADEAVRILDESDSVDFDQREEQWRGEGWAGWTGGTMNNQRVADSGTPMTTSQQQQPQMQQGQMQQDMQSGQTVAEEHIPLVEEELRVGKREVNRGGARVRSYVREVPGPRAGDAARRACQRRAAPGQRDARPRCAGPRQRPASRPYDRDDRDSRGSRGRQGSAGPRGGRRQEDRRAAHEQIDDTVRRTEVDVEEGPIGQNRQSGSAFGFDNQDGSRTEAERADFERTNNPGFRQ